MSSPKLSSNSLGGQYQEIPISQIVLNDWNPNQMREAELERLKKEISENGMIDPIQVVPEVTEDTGLQYRVIGGEHRLRACKELGYSTIPAILLIDAKWRDQELQQLVTVRLNVIKGNLNPEKMMALYQKVSDKYGDKSVADLMGFADNTALKKAIGDTKRALKDYGVNSNAIRELENVEGEIRTMDNLSNVLNNMFTKYGGTVQKHFMYFEFGGKKHVYVELEKKGFNNLNKMLNDIESEGLDVALVLDQMFRKWSEVVNKDTCKNKDVSKGDEQYVE